VFGKGRPGGSSDFVFPDWSPYRDLDAAARSYLRDADLALADLGAMLEGRPVLGFTLERVVLDDGRVWQEIALCDGERLLLWHGEDVPETDPATMTSAVRTIGLRSVTEVGARRHVRRDESGAATTTEVEAYVLLRTVDEAETVHGDDGVGTVVRHDALRFGKSVADGGEGQVARLMEFIRLVSGLVGSRR